jgi:mRNA interferase YafQ
MRTIEWTSSLKKDYRRTASSSQTRNLDTLLDEVIDLLKADLPLSRRHRDHALSGTWTDFRECHVRPDLLLIYQKIGLNVLRLVRVGTHSQLFGK